MNKQTSTGSVALTRQREDVTENSQPKVEVI